MAATRIFICFSSLVVDLTRPIGPGPIDVYLSVISSYDEFTEDAAAQTASPSAAFHPLR
jgi:hypothetical protein